MNQFGLGFDRPIVLPTDRELRLAGKLALLGGLLVLAWRACHSTHRQRLGERSLRLPAALHTWEGEGGRPLPAASAQGR